MTSKTARSAAKPPGILPTAMYTVAAAAAIVSTSERQLWKEIRLGRLRATKLGPRITRISEIDLAAYIDERRQESA